MRNPPWLQSLLQSLSRLRPPCPRRWPNPRHRQSASRASTRPEAKRPAPGSKNKPKPPKTVPAEEAVPAPAPDPAHAPSAAPAAPEPARPEPPAEPVRMTPAQERALRYMQRQDRYMELLARNTHEL